MTDFDEVNQMYEENNGGGLPEVDQLIYLALLDNDKKKARELTKQIYVEIWKTAEGSRLAAFNKGRSPGPPARGKFSSTG